MNISVRICNTRKRYLLALVVIIVMGLLSRRVMWLPNSTGDMFLGHDDVLLCSSDFYSLASA